MAKIEHSKNFQAIMKQNRLEENWNGQNWELFQTISVQKDWKKFGMAKIGHSIFFHFIIVLVTLILSGGAVAMFHQV